MKRYGLTLFILTVAVGVNAQVSVYDCGVYDKNMTQTEVNNSPQSIHAACITLGENGNMNIGSTTQRTFIASDEITLKDDVTLGVFSPGGEVHLKNGEKSGNLDVAVMNYASLHGVLRYKKLEFGIEVPANILTRVNHYLHNEGVFTDELNPFLEWDVDLEATFTHLATGQTKKIDGFYTRDYVVNTQTDDWDDVGTNYPFRIRFAPPLNGEWSVKISLRIKNETIPSETADDFWFTTVESGDPGYVKVHENQVNLKQGDRIIIPVGQNFMTPDNHKLAWGGDSLYLGHVLYNPSDPQNLNTEKMANTLEWKSYRDHIESYLQQGGKFFRTIQSPWSSLLEFEKKGNYYKRLHYAYEQDKLLDMCEQYNALVQFNLLHQTVYEKYDPYFYWMWDWDNFMIDTIYQQDHLHVQGSWQYNVPVYCYNDDPSYRVGTTTHFGKKPYEMFTDISDLAYHKQRTRYYVARYGYSTKIYELEISSEPWHINESKWEERPYDTPANAEYTLARNAVYNYHQVMSTYLKDSLHCNQLVGVNTLYNWELPYNELEDMIALPKIDVVGTNVYYTNPEAQFRMQDNVMKIWKKRNPGMQYGSPIPVMLSEGGTDGDYIECSNHNIHKIDVSTLPMSMVCGFNAWYGDTNAYNKYWPYTIRAQQHYNANDVIGTLSNGGGAWTHRRDSAFVKMSFNGGVFKEYYFLEAQYYISNDKKQFVGYVRNRSYNIETRSSDCSTCICHSLPFVDYQYPVSLDWILPEKKKRINVKGLNADKKYSIDWYVASNSQTNSYYNSNCLKAKNDSIDLHFPTLFVLPQESPIDRPVMWFVGHQGCSNNLEQNNEREFEEELETENFLQIESQEDKGVKIYPNPFDDRIFVESAQDDELLIQSLNGALICSFKLNAGINELSNIQLKTGMYLAVFKKQNVTQKLLKR